MASSVHLSSGSSSPSSPGWENVAKPRSAEFLPKESLLSIGSCFLQIHPGKRPAPDLASASSAGYKARSRVTQGSHLRLVSPATTAGTFATSCGLRQAGHRAGGDTGASSTAPVRWEHDGRAAMCGCVTTLCKAAAKAAHHHHIPTAAPGAREGLTGGDVAGGTDRSP